MIKYRQAAQTFGKAQSRMGTDLFVRSKRHKTLEEQDASRAFNDEVIRVRAEFYSTATAQDMKSPGLRANPSLVRKLKASCLYTECATTWRGQATKGYRLSMPWRLSFRDLNAVKADKVEHRTTPCKRRADLLGLEAPVSLYFLYTMALRPKKRHTFPANHKRSLGHIGIEGSKEVKSGIMS